MPKPLVTMFLPGGDPAPEGGALASTPVSMIATALSWPS